LVVGIKEIIIILIVITKELIKVMLSQL